MDDQSPSDPFNQSVSPARPLQSHAYDPATPDEQPTSPPVRLHAQQNPYPPPALPGNDRDSGKAIAGLTLGIISQLTWLIPFGDIMVANMGIVFSAQTLNIIFTCACLIFFGNVLVALVGIMLSAQGLRSRLRKGLATAGLVLSIIGLMPAIGVLLLVLIFILGRVIQ